MRTGSEGMSRLEVDEAEFLTGCCLEVDGGRCL